MCSIAEEHHTAAVPVANGVAVGDRPPPPQIQHANQGAHRGVSVAVSTIEFGAIRCDITLLRVALGAKHRNNVELSAVAERIMHDMHAGTAPERHTIAGD